MRVPSLFLVLLTVALFTSGCMGGPENSDERLTAACERQRAEIENAEEESVTPEAPSTTERLEEITLVECAGQPIKVVDPTEDEGKAGEGDAPAEGDEPAGDGEEPAAGDDAPTTPVALDPAARTLFAETCGGCHALSDAETTGAVGPNLDDTTMDAAAVEEQIIKGGGAMPPALLEGDDAKAVAEYVAGAAAAN